MKKFLLLVLNIFLEKIVSRLIKYMKLRFIVDSSKKIENEKIRTIREITDEIYGLEYELEQIENDKTQLDRKLQLVEEIEKLELELRKTTRELGLH
jgi:hypothetical protein